MTPPRNSKSASKNKLLSLEKENREVKDLLNEALIKYKALTETAQDYIFIVSSTGIIEFVNSYAASIIHKKPEQLIGLPHQRIFKPDLHKRQISNINKVIASGKPISLDTKSVFVDKSLWLSTSLYPIFDDKGKVKSVLGISRDITDLKNSEEALKLSEEKLRMLIEQAADGIFVGDCSGNFVGVNSKACELTGYSKKELISMNMQDLFAKNELSRVPLRYDLLNKGETVRSERALKKKDKKEVAVEMNTRQMSDGTYQAIMRNITQRKKEEKFMLQYQEDLEKLVKDRTFQLERANLKLKKENTERLRTESMMKFQLKEKEILLKEVHHRVKNNMQVIISLLNLQAATISDNMIHELYMESQNRIKSMALIHEKLYQSKDLTHIDFKEYANSLSSYLAHTYLTGGRSVKIITRTQNISLEYDTAISLGLIINELVSNSMKYAFEGITNGKVEISLNKQKDNMLRLCVADNGKGIPKNIDFRNTRSLGLQLVCSLTEQIGGDISMENHAGTKFCIHFRYIHK
jgi:PAS domain S-box-containing protein